MIKISCFCIWFGYLCAQTGLFLWFGHDFELALNDGLISATTLTGACYLIANTLNYYLPSQRNYLQIAVWALVLSALSLAASRWALTFLTSDALYLAVVDQSLPVRLCFQAGSLAWVATINILWNVQQDNRDHERRKTDAERLAREAELHNLHRQLQPHFLFNSLNSIVALIAKDPKKAQEMTFQLSAFLRSTLRDHVPSFIPLEEEVEQLRLYLAIEKVRFEHRLETQILIENGAGAALVPPLILQPLIENAVKFGLYGTSGRIQIRLQASLTENRMLRIEIQNPFNPRDARPRKGTGFGLKGLRRRLFLLYARGDLLDTHAHQDRFTTILQLPHPQEQPS